MNKNGTHAKFRPVAMAFAMTFAVLGASASPSSDDRSLERGAVADATPQQRYQSAIREAGGAYKESQRDCAALATPKRPACLREAKQTYERDMADARRLLSR